MKLIKNWLKRRRHKRKLRELSQFVSVFTSLDKLQDGGVLEWDGKNRRLFIDSDLALLMINQGADGWRMFIQNVYLWQYSKLCDRAWADYFQQEELKAVRDYQQKLKDNSQLSTLRSTSGRSQGENSQLSRSDIDRIREARRQEILQSDMQAPKIEPFEFFIVSPPTGDGSGVTSATSRTALGLPLATEGTQEPSPVGRLISVGHYDPETEQMEMALWRDVQTLLNTNHKL